MEKNSRLFLWQSGFFQWKSEFFVITEVLILVPWAWVHIVHLTKKDSDFQGTIVKVDQTERSDGSTDNPIINK